MIFVKIKSLKEIEKIGLKDQGYWNYRMEKSLPPNRIILVEKCYKEQKKVFDGYRDARKGGEYAWYIDERICTDVTSTYIIEKNLKRIK